MKLVSTAIGGAIIGALAFGIWPEMWKTYGIMGGWLASAILVGICWYMNHWLGVISNEPGSIWVDQGWAVCAAGIAWGMVRFGSQFYQALPTLICCLIGGGLAGIVAAKVKKHNASFNKPRNAAAAAEAEKLEEVSHV
jgi:hypothetical protein